LKFILGTATFGSNYGILNRSEVMYEKNCFDLLEEARRLGIASLDTAAEYGDSQAIIGRFHDKWPEFEVYSKIKYINSFTKTQLATEVDKSLSLLKVDTLAGLLFHNPLELFNHPLALVNETLSYLQATAKVKMLGVSVYEESEIEIISRQFPQIRLFQVPENIMDQRLINSNIVRDLKKAGYVFHVRSVFMQGLLLAQTGQLNHVTEGLQLEFNKFINFCKEQNFSQMEACLSYVAQLEWADGVVLGAFNARQLTEVIERTKVSRMLSNLPDPFEPTLVDPRNWSAPSNH
jgi:aryl-alcohol dehydrogenase-like predicted oxidoreductase